MSLFISEEKREKRLEVCRRCVEYNATLYQCRECGCFLKIKSLLKNQKCPKGKWNE